jgi:zinc-ribbon domain
MAVATLWYYPAYDRQEERPMFCPNCSAQIEETQKYCRSCGTDVSLVSQALKGQLPSSDAFGTHREYRRRLRERRREDKRPPGIEGAVRTFFTGIGFIFVSFAALEFAPAGGIWWFWLLIPAFSCMGAGIGQFLKLREQRRQQQGSQIDSTPGQPAFTSPTARMPEISAQTPSAPPSSSSVTEHTTKNLDPSRSN